MKNRVASVDVRAAVLELLKNKRNGATASKILDELTLVVKLPRVTNALHEMLDSGEVCYEGFRPRLWFIPPHKPYTPHVDTPRIQRFDWTRETYIPPPPPALRPGAMDFKRFPSVGTP